jgi:hypothetical protein
MARPVLAAIVPSALPVENAVLVSTVDTGAWSPPAIDPSGIAYLSDVGELLVADSEVDEEPTVFTGVNLFQTTTNGVLTATGLSPDLPVEPTGLSYDPATQTLFISNDRTERLYLVKSGADGTFGTADDVVSSFDISRFGSVDSEDVAFDTRSGDLFLADGIGSEVFRLNAGANGVFDGIAPDGDDIVTSFDIPGTEIEDAEGLGYRASSDTLLLVDAGSDESIFEMTKSGQLLRRIDLDVINIPGGVPETPSDVVVAPASDGSGAQHLYVVDRKADNGDPADEFPPPVDGRLYELTAPFADLAPFVDAGANAVVTISAGAELNGEAYDDGQPAIGALTTSWAKQSGPGDVTFADPTSTVTDVTFGATGTYVLELTASDTASSTVDTVEVIVIPDPVINTVPIVDAGPDISVVLADGAVLGGSALDDGLPSPPASLTHHWEKRNGPGSISFGSPTELATSVSFSAPGVYTLRLTVSDSELSGFDEVAVTVAPNPVVVQDCVDEDYPGHPFSDLGGFSEEVNGAVDCLGFYGISTGTSATTFSPTEDVSRWQMALFLTRQARIQGIPLPNGADQGFTDIVAYPASVQTAINQLAQLGITQGTAPDTFAPGESVTRWQMALFLSRLLTGVGVGLPDGSSQGYGDIVLLPLPTQVAINQITQLGVAKGTASGVFSPLDDVSRWQMALFLDRGLDVGGLP